jgi:hypothetical protein
MSISTFMACREDSRGYMSEGWSKQDGLERRGEAPRCEEIPWSLGLLEPMLVVEGW